MKISSARQGLTLTWYRQAVSICWAPRICGYITCTIYIQVLLWNSTACTQHKRSACLFLQFVFIVALFEHCDGGFFELFDETSLNVYREAEAVSHMQCAFACNGGTDCDEFGFSTSSRQCYFSTNDVGIAGEAREVPPDMTVYRKPGKKSIYIKYMYIIMFAFAQLCIPNDTLYNDMTMTAKLHQT